MARWELALRKYRPARKAWEQLGKAQVRSRSEQPLVIFAASGPPATPQYKARPRATQQIRPANQAGEIPDSHPRRLCRRRENTILLISIRLRIINPMLTRTAAVRAGLLATFPVCTLDDSRKRH